MVCLPNMTLKSVLHVPKLTYNLLSVSKLTKDLNCVVTFFSSHCEFQDRSSGKMIGIAEKKDGLYYLLGARDSSRAKSQNKMSTSVISNSDVMLWHQRLGHPSFSYMKVFYPNLFINKEKVLFRCEQCVLAKQTRAKYPPHIYKPSRPFQLIHSDIWGPSRTVNLTRTQ